MNKGFSLIEREGVKLISVDCINDTGVFNAFYSTGYSGVSTGLAGETTMNLNLFKKFKDADLDEKESYGKENSRKNLQLFSKACGFSLNKLAAVHELHSNVVHQAKAPLNGEVFNPKAYADGDAQVAQLKDDLALFVYASDCCTLLLADPTTGVYATTHCGWKNSLNGTIHNLIENFTKSGGNKDEVLVAIGPALDQKCMEIGQDVYDLFVGYSKEFKDDIVEKPEARGKYLIDLFSINTRLLVREGVKYDNIFPSGICNKCEYALPSYRVGKGRNGVMAGIIYPKIK